MLFLRQTVQLPCLLRADGKGLFAQNMLALLQAELAVFVMQGVGGGDIDGLHLRVSGKGFVGVIAAGDAVLLRKRCALSRCRDPTAKSCSPSAPICSTVDANFLAMVPVAKIPHFITVPPGLLLWIRCVQYTMVFPCGKDSEKQKCPRRLVPTLRGQILCTGIIL